MTDFYCNNCGKKGHLYNQCKTPITSTGVVAFRIYNGEIQFLMIRRKDTLGFIDFMRGKYSLCNKDYIKNMVLQMTVEEREMLKTHSFQDLWIKVWGNNNLSGQYKNEESSSKEKFNLLRKGIVIKSKKYTLSTIIDECKDTVWEEQEWGFPKGRRNYQEKDHDCALREFSEETGYSKNSIHTIENIFPFDEIFTGSNYKSYKHKYFVAFMNTKDTLQTNKYQRSEVGKMDWKSYRDCMKVIRSYNLEKKRVLTNIYKTLSKFPLMYFNTQ
jgi:8-oxo-dGTP pyrophosphatase MutT (NUDIX family)|uniref:Nudix hydrolase domain-containing protein n=1 Tax=viral metagenome TaxID=1070528 RepID=A0A6C0IN44_9ZZZZ